MSYKEVTLPSVPIVPIPMVSSAVRAVIVGVMIMPAMMPVLIFVVVRCTTFYAKRLMWRYFVGMSVGMPCCVIMMVMVPCMRSM
jgi:hypothetical protein